LFSLFLVLNADQCKRVTVEYKFFSAVVTDLRRKIDSNIFNSAINFDQGFVSQSNICILPDFVSPISLRSLRRYVVESGNP
jgi:hypothetical protein